MVAVKPSQWSCAFVLIIAREQRLCGRGKTVLSLASALWPDRMLRYSIIFWLFIHWLTESLQVSNRVFRPQQLFTNFLVSVALCSEVEVRCGNSMCCVGKMPMCWFIRIKSILKNQNWIVAGLVMPFQILNQLLRHRICIMADSVVIT